MSNSTKINKNQQAEDLDRVGALLDSGKTFSGSPVSCVDGQGYTQILNANRENSNKRSEFLKISKENHDFYLYKNDETIFDINNDKKTPAALRAVEKTFVSATDFLGSYTSRGVNIKDVSKDDADLLKKVYSDSCRIGSPDKDGRHAVSITTHIDEKPIAKNLAQLAIAAAGALTTAGAGVVLVGVATTVAMAVLGTGAPREFLAEGAVLAGSSLAAITLAAAAQRLPSAIDYVVDKFNGNERNDALKTAKERIESGFKPLANDGINLDAKINSVPNEVPGVRAFKGLMASLKDPEPKAGLKMSI